MGLHLGDGFGYALAEVLGLKHLDVSPEGEDFGHQLFIDPHGEGNGVGLLVVFDDALFLAKGLGLHIGITLVRHLQDYLFDGHIAVATHTHHIVEPSMEIHLRFSVCMPPLADGQYAVEGKVEEVARLVGSGEEEPTAVELLEIVGMYLQLSRFGLLIGFVADDDGVAVDDALEKGGEVGVTGKGVVVLETDIGLGGVEGTSVGYGLQGGEHPLPLGVLLVGIAVALAKQVDGACEGIMVGGGELEQFEIVGGVAIAVVILLFQLRVELHVVGLGLEILQIFLYGAGRDGVQVVFLHLAIAAFEEVFCAIATGGVLKTAVEHLIAQHFVSVDGHDEKGVILWPGCRFGFGWHRGRLSFLGPVVGRYRLWVGWVSAPGGPTQRHFRAPQVPLAVGICQNPVGSCSLCFEYKDTKNNGIERKNGML